MCNARVSIENGLQHAYILLVKDHVHKKMDWTCVKIKVSACAKLVLGRLN